MNLLELKPHWITLAGAGDDKLGMTFRCPHCPPGGRGETTFLGIWFANPVDPDKHPDVDWPHYMLSHPEQHFWQRSGDEFASMTITPSIDASQHGHWHGFIRNGEIT